MITESHPCDILLNDVLEAFERVTRGTSPNCPNAVVDVLLEYGLIRRTVGVIGRDSLGPVIRYGYSVPSKARANSRFST
ncbi:hypothetical protein M2171_002560 [Bradyrhizobium japonicum USDA 38]|nr:hypothetical protein [Bradyrhizobium japonicum USDA 38]MCS3945941.1 hypothetical protein [Bradyrhizobium japonicum]